MQSGLRVLLAQLLHVSQQLLTVAFELILLGVLVASAHGGRLKFMLKPIGVLWQRASSPLLPHKLVLVTLLSI